MPSRISGACNACRTRKQKCSGDRTGCAQCREAGHECTWPAQKKRGYVSRLSSVARSRHLTPMSWHLLCSPLRDGCADMKRPLRPSFMRSYNSTRILLWLLLTSLNGEISREFPEICHILTNMSCPDPPKATSKASNIAFTTRNNCSFKSFHSSPSNNLPA